MKTAVLLMVLLCSGCAMQFNPYPPQNDLAGVVDTLKQMQQVINAQGQAINELREGKKEKAK